MPTNLRVCERPCAPIRGSDPGRREPDALFRNALRHRVAFCGIIY